MRSLPRAIPLLAVPLCLAWALAGCGDEDGTDAAGDTDAGDTDPSDTDPGTDPGDTDPGDTDDTDGPAPYDGPIQVASLEVPTCVGDLWTYDVLLDGIADRVTLDIVETADSHFDDDPNAVWSEAHEFDDNYSRDPVRGAFDGWRLELARVGDISDVTPGATTLFGCEYGADKLAWKFSVYGGGVLGVPQDCVILGLKAEQAYGTDCRCIDEDADCTN